MKPEHHANLHSVMIVDANERHQKELAACLFSFYEVSTYTSVPEALARLESDPPALVITSEQVTPYGGFNFIKAMRQKEELIHIPVIYITAKDDYRMMKVAQFAGASSSLAKPYRRSVLINTISSLLNAQVESNWEKLPEIQKAALKDTVATFNNIADVISTGTPLPFNDISKACAPLIHAIKNHDFKDILDGVKEHDNYTFAHSMRVATLLSLLGEAAGLNEEEHLMLATGGLLHDVGKMLIPHHILNKPGRLNEVEFSIMKNHVPETVAYLKSCGDIPRPVITIAEQHHEKLNGTGYPYGLAGGQLNELARMAAIVDVFSALTDRRIYKPAMPPEQALFIMTDEMEGHLDLHYLGLFKTMLLDAVDKKHDRPVVHNPGHQGCC